MYWDFAVVLQNMCGGEKYVTEKFVKKVTVACERILEERQMTGSFLGQK